MYKILNKLFGWDYIWSYSPFFGNTMIFRINEKNKNWVLEVIINQKKDTDIITWLTCDATKYTQETNFTQYNLVLFFRKLSMKEKRRFLIWIDECVDKEKIMKH